MENQNHHGSVSSNREIPIPKDILDDLSSRFIINVPDGERTDSVRICFQIELAHWFYLDFYCVEDTSLPNCNIRDFIYTIFHHIPSMRKFSQQFDEIYTCWKEYKMGVPTCGAILLDESMEDVLLVQGYFAKSSWGFPKGKINEQEEPHNCAIREVLEETGFDISSMINKDLYLQHYFNDQLIRLYIVPGISKNAKFQPQTRNEIKKVEWFHIKDIPCVKRKTGNGGLSANAFFMVFPFMRPLKKWIADQQKVENPSPFGDQEQQPGMPPKTPTEQEKSQNRNQQIFAQLSANELASMLQMKEKTRSHVEYPSRNSRTTYTPPPRMLKQQKMQKQSMEHIRNRTYRPSPESVINKNQAKSGQFIKRSLGSFFKDSNKKDFNMESFAEDGIINVEDAYNPSYWHCKEWDNFLLDRRALVACFNINLRKEFVDS